MADKHTRLYSGYLIPVPQAKGDNTDKRTCFGFLWGDATGDAVVSHKSDSRKDAEGATPKCTVVFKAAKTTFKVSVTTKSMWFDALRHIKKGDRCPMYTEDDGETWHDLCEDDIVSMNLWGFQPAFFEEMEQYFHNFLLKNFVKFIIMISFRENKCYT